MKVGISTQAKWFYCRIDGARSGWYSVMQVAEQLSVSCPMTPLNKEVLMNEFMATTILLVLFSLRFLVPLAATIGIGFLMNRICDRWEAAV